MPPLFRALRPLARHSLGIGRSAPLLYFRRSRMCDEQTAPWWTWLRGELRLCAPFTLVDAIGAEYAFKFKPSATLAAVPVAVVVTSRDTVVPPSDQRAMALRIGANTIELAAGHHVFITDPAVCVEIPLRTVEALSGWKSE